MMQQVEAVYEAGVLRPLSPVALSESQRVRITIDGSGRGILDTDLVEQARAEVAAMTDPPTIQEVRRLLSTITGSVAEAVIAERGEY